MQVILIFVDGMGMGEQCQQNNPYLTATTPFLDSLLGGHFLLIEQEEQVRRGRNWTLYATDASLGVDGIPQSATGQTTLLTGINSAKVIGRHLRGFPNAQLRQLIRENSIFKQLLSRGYSCTFANVYRTDILPVLLEQVRYHSVTTTAAIGANLKLRNLANLDSGTGVYQDITNSLLRAENDYAVEIVGPEEAGERLGRLGATHDFILFEYFQSDVAGHKQDRDKIRKIWHELDQFIKGVVHTVDLQETVVIMSSDHGNMEDISQKTHTANKVPTLIISEHQEALNHHIGELADITPFIIEIISKEAQ